MTTYFFKNLITANHIQHSSQGPVIIATHAQISLRLIHLVRHLQYAAVQQQEDPLTDNLQPHRFVACSGAILSDGGSIRLTPTCQNHATIA